MKCVQVKMVTGDQYAIAVETSRRLGLGTKIMEGEELLGAKATNLEFAKHVEAMDGFAGVFPEHKHRIVEAVQLSGRLVGMTGLWPLQPAPPPPLLGFCIIIILYFIIPYYII